MPESKTHICVLVERRLQPLRWAWWPQGKLFSSLNPLGFFTNLKKHPGPCKRLHLPSDKTGYHLGRRENALSRFKAIYTLISLFSGGINSPIVKPLTGHKISFSSQILWSSLQSLPWTFSQVDCLAPLHLVLLGFLSCSFIWNMFICGFVLSKLLFSFDRWMDT